MVNNWLHFIQTAIFPPRCLLCGHAGMGDLDLCAGCFNDLPKNLAYCDCCGSAAINVDKVPTLCANCRQKQPAFDTTCAPFLYQTSMAHLIRALKFSNHYANARLLGLLLAQSLANRENLPDCIIPVPLHRHRYRERGFNQSIEIGRTVSKQLCIPLDAVTCARHRDTPHQTGLSADERQRNIKQAFSVVADCCYRHVALLDDVMTTGSTVDELASTLKQAGVERVDVWVCARAV